MTVEALSDALTLARAGTGSFRSDVPDGWQQGRGAFGGLVLGLLARAMEQEEVEPERTLRTLSGEILAPVLPGQAELRVESLRRGSALTSAAARLWQDGEIRAHASALLGKGRVQDREHLGLTAPEAQRWEEVEPVPVAPPFGPEFGRAFEYRNLGPLPFSGSSDLRCEGFIRAMHPPASLTPAALIAYVDAWWPTALGREEGPRPMATVAFSFQLLAGPSTLDPSAPLRFRSSAFAAHDGFISEVRELWTLDGRLVALNPQTFVYIK